MSFILNYFIAKNQIEIGNDKETNEISDILEELNVSPSETKPDLKVVLNNQFSFINKLNRQEKIKIINSLEDKNDIVNCFLTMNEVDRYYIYPLFNQTIKELILFNCNPEDKKYFNANQEEFDIRNQEFKNNKFSTGSSILFYLDTKNYLKNSSSNKYSYILSANELVKFNLKPYKYQRKINKKHLENISNGIKKSGVLFHPIVCTQNCKTDEITIIDGNHRVNSLSMIDETILKKIKIQLDIILADDDTEIMNIYKSINTLLPFDPNYLAKELEYVNLVEQIKLKIGPGIVQYSKKTNEQEASFVIDLYLKEELQIRELLNKYSSEEIINKIVYINSYMKKYENELNAIQRRVCKRDNIYLGINWPECIDKIEKDL
jgi:hypothetical protein